MGGECKFDQTQFVAVPDLTNPSAGVERLKILVAQSWAGWKRHERNCCWSFLREMWGYLDVMWTDAHSMLLLKALEINGFEVTNPDNANEKQIFHISDCHNVLTGATRYMIVPDYLLREQAKASIRIRPPPAGHAGSKMVVGDHMIIEAPSAADLRRLKFREQ